MKKPYHSMEEYESACKASYSYEEVAQKLGIKFGTTAKRNIVRLGIDVSHFRFKRVDSIKSCLNCGVETTNPKFCSQSCSALYSNYNYHKDKERKKRYCRLCDNEVSGYKILCQECKKRTIKYNDDSLLSDIPNSKAGFRSSIIQSMARKLVYSSGEQKRCRICGYDKHAEVCHIKAISSFDLATKINEVNNLNNLIVLCPNCHWELDNGLIENIYEYK